jgi:hypothetical protein
MFIAQRGFRPLETTYSRYMDSLIDLSCDGGAIYLNFERHYAFEHSAELLLCSASVLAVNLLETIIAA